MKPVVVIQGAASADEVPGIERVLDRVELRFANDDEALAKAIAGAEIVFGWNFRGNGLQSAWHHATDLKWIQWAGAGVDAVLFDELRDSEVQLTNLRGMFDRAMAEWTLGQVLFFAKDTRKSLDNQRDRVWDYRIADVIHNKSALIVGAGSIGRECAKLLKRVDMTVSGVGRSSRTADPDFGDIHSVDELLSLLPNADYVVLITPLTDDTRGLFGAAQFAAMKPTACFINIGRGQLVDENALLHAIESEQIAGAALDVFCTEPLPEDHPLWTANNVFVSPHMSGDYPDYEARVVDVFVENLDRYLGGKALVNVVDKKVGFVTS